ncbi:hypothetical protein ACJX0J_019485 [Zea mays]
MIFLFINHKTIVVDFNKKYKDGLIGLQYIFQHFHFLCDVVVYSNRWTRIEDMIQCGSLYYWIRNGWTHPRRLRTILAEGVFVGHNTLSLFYHQFRVVLMDAWVGQQSLSDGMVYYLFNFFIFTLEYIKFDPIYTKKYKYLSCLRIISMYTDDVVLWVFALYIKKNIGGLFCQTICFKNALAHMWLKKTHLFPLYIIMQIK